MDDGRKLRVNIGHLSGYSEISSNSEGSFIRVNNESKNIKVIESVECIDKLIEESINNNVTLVDFAPPSLDSLIRDVKMNQLKAKHLLESSNE